MPRPARLSLLVAGILAFALASILLARFLSTENAERDALFGLLRAQARGDVAGMLARLDGCVPRPGCRSAVVADARGLRTQGEVKILAQTSATAYALSGATGLTRVAWKAGSRLPVVQCVLVRRRGNALAGLSVTLLSIGRPIAGTATC